jgi:DNA-binding transcriptional MocR family regulator
MPEIQEDKVKIHLRLTKQQWVQDFKNLTRAQLGVLYYIETSDPFGDRGLEVTATAIAKELGLDKSSVSRALKQLDQMGYIDSEIIRARVKVLHPRHNVASTQPMSQQRNLHCTNTNDVVESEPLLPQNDKRRLLPKLDKEPLGGHSLNTYSNFINSLSQTDREKFFEFGLKKAAQLPHPPALPQRWIERNWQEISTEFQKSSPLETDWNSHPKRDEWIQEIRKGRPRFVAYGGPDEENEIRRQFAAWAEANNLVWGTSS